MKKFQVLADSTADLGQQQRETYDVEYLKMVFNLKEQQYDADIDWKEMSAQDFYGAMRTGSLFKTGQVKTEECETKFKTYLEQGLDVLYIACSSKLSGSVHLAETIAREVLENYPERKIICIDSLRSTAAQGLMAIEAAKLSAQGLDIVEAAQKIEEEKLKFQTFCTVGSLEWLKKAGRVKASAAFFGNLFGVKPIIIGDAKGNNYAYKKVKGRKTSLDDIVASVKARIENPGEATVYVEHADSLKDAQYVVDAISSQVHPKEIVLCYVGPIIGATTGPDTIAVSFYGEKVTIVGEE